MKKLKKSDIVPGIVIAILVIVVILQYAAYHTNNGANSTVGLMQYLSDLEQSFTVAPTATTTEATSTDMSTETHPTTTPSKPVVYAKPMLYRLSPQSGTSMLTVTITGTGFDPATNDISFGGTNGLHALNGLPANIVATEGSGDGTTLTFNVPLDQPNGLLCDSTGKNCKAIEPAVNPPGSYAITVTNRGGVSNTLWFTIQN